MVGERGLAFAKRSGKKRSGTKRSGKKRSGKSAKGAKASSRSPATHRLVLLGNSIKLNHPYILNILSVFHVI